MPMPKPVCRTKLYNKIVQLEVCITFSGRGMGISGTAHLLLSTPIIHSVLVFSWAGWDLLVARAAGEKPYSMRNSLGYYIYIYIYIYVCINN